MKVETTSEDLAKSNAITVWFCLEEMAGMKIDLKTLQVIKNALQNDIENGSIKRSVAQYNKEFKIK